MELLPRIDDELCTGNPLVVTLENVLPPEACLGLIDRIEALGPSAAPITTSRGLVMRPDLRNNDRVMFDDPDLATRLVEAARPRVPERLEQDWVLCGANERLRCYRYRPGQHFAPHFDGAFHRSTDERSLLTFLVYLNGCRAGGSTRLLDLGIEVEPRAGLGFVFNHHLLHEGAPVLEGVKYVVRTDLMYRRSPNSKMISTH
jgi:hypothetical protein